MNQILIINRNLPEPLPNTTKLIYVGRGSSFGNPYSHLSKSKAEFKTDTGDSAIANYEIWFKHKIRNDAVFLEEFLDLVEICRKHDVALECYCKPKRCHAEIIKKALTAYLESTQINRNLI